ncbi:MAG: 4-(cytidine 5'-diphospho)-2-C-methyl-D-erythritol kinase [Pseudomonadota bacterium]
MKINSPAKINLFLHIIGKRSHGYHDIHSLMCGVSLYDTLTLDFQASKIAVACKHSAVPEDETNIAYRAAECFFDALRHPGGVSIHIEKHIPVAAGLGGGSSNAAGILSGLNTHYGHPFSKRDLVSLALTLGADVPFFIHQKPALATGVGENLEFFKGILPYPIVLIRPDIQVSTADVYKNLNLGLTNCEQKLKSFPLNKGFNPLRHLCNDLETVTISWYPEISDIKKALLDQGALGSLMSGSGPTVFGIFSDSDRAKKAYKTLSTNQRWSCFVTQLLV